MDTQTEVASNEHAVVDTTFEEKKVIVFAGGMKFSVSYDKAAIGMIVGGHNFSLDGVVQVKLGNFIFNRRKIEAICVYTDDDAIVSSENKLSFWISGGNALSIDQGYDDVFGKDN